MLLLVHAEGVFHIPQGRIDLGELSVLRKALWFPQVGAMPSHEQGVVVVFGLLAPRRIRDAVDLQREDGEAIQNVAWGAGSEHEVA